MHFKNSSYVHILQPFVIPLPPLTTYRPPPDHLSTTSRTPPSTTSPDHLTRPPHATTLRDHLPITSPTPHPTTSSCSILIPTSTLPPLPLAGLYSLFWLLIWIRTSFVDRTQCRHHWFLMQVLSNSFISNMHQQLHCYWCGGSDVIKVVQETPCGGWININQSVIILVNN